MEPSIPVEKKSIFRSDAVEQYVQQREKSVLPRYITPPLFTALWGLLLLLILGSLLAWATRVPIYAPGVATVVWQEETAVLVAFVQPHIEVEVGHTLIVDGPRGRERVPITSVGDEILGPKDVADTFGERAASLVRQPTITIMTPLTVDDTMNAATYLDSTYSVQLQIGSQRVISLFPVVGKFFKES